jgi:hypothetical protein
MWRVRGRRIAGSSCWLGQSRVRDGLGPGLLLCPEDRSGLPNLVADEAPIAPSAPSSTLR